MRKPQFFSEFFKPLFSGRDIHSWPLMRAEIWWLESQDNETHASVKIMRNSLRNLMSTICHHLQRLEQESDIYTTDNYRYACIRAYEVVRPIQEVIIFLALGRRWDLVDPLEREITAIDYAISEHGLESVTLGQIVASYNHNMLSFLS